MDTSNNRELPLQQPESTGWLQIYQYIFNHKQWFLLGLAVLLCALLLSGTIRVFRLNPIILEYQGGAVRKHIVADYFNKASSDARKSKKKFLVEESALEILKRRYYRKQARRDAFWKRSDIAEAIQLQLKAIVGTSATEILNRKKMRPTVDDVRQLNRRAQILICVLDTPYEPTAAEMTEIKKKANAIIKRARNGESFSDLANTNSSYVWNKRNGYIGEVEFNSLTPIERKVLFGVHAGTYAKNIQTNIKPHIRPGEVSKPFKTQYGYYILKPKHYRGGVFGNGPLRLMVGLQRIILKVNDNTKEEWERQRQRAEDIYNQIVSGSISFGDAANKYSDDPANFMGGYVGSKVLYESFASPYLAAHVYNKLEKGWVDGFFYPPWGYVIFKIQDLDRYMEGNIKSLQQNPRFMKTLSGRKRSKVISTINHKLLYLNPGLKRNLAVLSNISSWDEMTNIRDTVVAWYNDIPITYISNILNNKIMRDNNERGTYQPAGEDIAFRFKKFIANVDNNIILPALNVHLYYKKIIRSRKLQDKIKELNRTLLFKYYPKVSVSMKSGDIEYYYRKNYMPIEKALLPLSSTGSNWQNNQDEIRNAVSNILFLHTRNYILMRDITYIKPILHLENSWNYKNYSDKHNYFPRNPDSRRPYKKAYTLCHENMSADAIARASALFEQSLAHEYLKPQFCLKIASIFFFYSNTNMMNEWLDKYLYHAGMIAVYHDIANRFWKFRNPPVAGSSFHSPYQFVLGDTTAYTEQVRKFGYSDLRNIIADPAYQILGNLTLPPTFYHACIRYLYTVDKQGIYEELKKAYLNADYSHAVRQPLYDMMKSYPPLYHSERINTYLALDDQIFGNH